MIEVVLMGVAVYVAVGVLAAVFFHAAGLGRIDSGVRGAGWFFRLLITPGMVALWPVLLLKWRKAGGGEDPAGRADRPVSPGGLRRAHRYLVTTLLVLLPLAVAAGLFVRPNISAGPVDAAPLYRVPEAFPTVAQEASSSVGQAEAKLRVLRDGSGRGQVELSLNRDAALPALALYWAMADKATKDGEGLPDGAVFLGSVWGPGLFRFPLPDSRDAVAGDGVFIIYSLGHRARVATLSGGLS